MKPLVISFFNGDPEVQLLSNFAHSPFELDGFHYATVEGFWQSLKTEDEAIRCKFRSLHDGHDAKQLGKTLGWKSTIFSYMNGMYSVGSQAHHVLLERAMRAKVLQNDVVKECLLATDSRPLIHATRNKFGGWRRGDSPALPAIVFENIWMRLREECRNNTLEQIPRPLGIDLDIPDLFISSN